MSTKVQTALAARISAKPQSAARPEGLSHDECRSVVATFISLFEGLYAHLPQKRASYGHDPVQRLRLLEQRLDAIDEDEFHQSMAEIVTDLRDAHTRYIGPAHVEGDVAFLPILVERYRDRLGDHYIVSKVFAADKAEERDFVDCGLVPEVEVTHWNGMPIARAVDRHAERETGGRPDARRARALESLTLRPLRYALPPYEDWVTVSYVGSDGQPGEVRLTWRFAREADLPRATLVGDPARLAYAGDPAAETARRVKKMLFASDKWYAAKAGKTPALRASLAARASEGSWFTGRFQDAVAARVVDTASGKFGHLRLWSFDVNDDDGYIAEVIDLLRALPRQGLIIDLRGNPGGLVWAAERLLQLFTPNLVTPTNFSILATDLTRSIAAAPQSRQQLEPWRHSLESAVSTGEWYSRGVPLTPPERCNDIGQRYPGPVVSIVDANTYSSGDLFAAGFVDHRIGTLISVDDATGAGGANVWYAHDVFRALEGTPAMPRPLPDGVTFTIAFRRAMRVGGIAGAGIEDVGVAGHLRQALTKLDLTASNKDLMAYCGRLLASETFTDLVVSAADGILTIQTTNLDRVDVYADNCPTASPYSANRRGPFTKTIELDRTWSEIEVIGYTGSIRRQCRKLRPSDE
jgi:C-terminal processing protease CtpA/Prc